MMAHPDPRGFLRRVEATGAVLDDIQRVPELLSHLQTLVDADPNPGRFVLTDSQNLSLMSAVSQTLAGRAAVATLLPFSLREANAPGTEPPPRETVRRGFCPRVRSRAIVCGGDGALPPPTVRSATAFSWRRF